MQVCASAERDLCSGKRDLHSGKRDLHIDIRDTIRGKRDLNRGKRDLRVTSEARDAIRLPSSRGPHEAGGIIRARRYQEFPRPSRRTGLKVQCVDLLAVASEPVERGAIGGV